MSEQYRRTVLFETVCFSPQSSCPNHPGCHPRLILFYFSFSSSFFQQQPFDFTYSPRKDKRQTVSQVKEGGGGEITNSRLWGTLCFACKYKFRVTYGEFSPPASSLREGG